MFNPRERFRPITLFVAWVLLCGIAGAAPCITLSKKSGPPTSKILVSGRGFEPNVGVDIYFDTKDEALVVTNGQGGFDNARIQAPGGAYPGQHWVTALERNNDKGAQKPFLVQTDWRQFGFSPSGGRLNPFENVIDPKNVQGLELKWTFATSGFVQSSPAIENGVLYITSGNVYAVDARAGAELWSYNLNKYSGTSPAVAGNVVYVGSGDSNVYALNARTGAKLWNYATGGGIYFALTVANGVVYAGSYDHSLYALDAHTGNKLWSFTTGGLLASEPVVANGVVYVGSDDHTLYALDASTGSDLWSYTTDGEIFVSAPALVDGVIYVASCGAGRSVYALNASTGALLWKYTTGDGIQASIAVAGGVVFVASADANLYALNAQTGVKLWSYGGEFYSSSPAIANGVVYIGSAGNDMYALDARTGTVLWSYATDTYFEYASPLVSDGTVYTGSDDGTFYAFALSAPGGLGEGSNRPDPKTLHPDFSLKVSEQFATPSGPRL